MSISSKTLEELASAHEAAISKLDAAGRELETRRIVHGMARAGLGSEASKFLGQLWLLHRELDKLTYRILTVTPDA